MKATNGIELVPSNGTFGVGEAVHMAASCIYHLKPERRVVVRPLPPDLCPCIISDKHWFVENLLCLLSNAVKYSDHGDVDLYVDLVDAAAMESSTPPHTPAEGPTIAKTDTVEMIRVPEASSRLFNKDAVAFTIRRKARDALAMESSKSEFPKTTRSTVGALVGGEQPAKVILVAVEDRGVGVPAEARSSLFQPYGQAQRRTGGTGLGLFSMFKRIEALGGKCGVSSRKDGAEGSLFWFTVPYRPDEAAADAERAEMEEAASLSMSPVGSLGSRQASAYTGGINVGHGSMSVRGFTMGAPPSRHGSVGVGTPRDSSRFRPLGGSFQSSSSSNHHSAGLRGSFQASALGPLKESAPDLTAIREIVSGSRQQSNNDVSADEAEVEAEAEEERDGNGAYIRTNIPALGPPPAATVERSPSAPVAPLLVPQSSSGGSSRGPTLKRCLLLVDDVETQLRIAGRDLRKNGFMVDTANDGMQGLEKLKRAYQDYDLMLTDLMMPVMDGFESTMKFRLWEEEQQVLREADGLPRRNRFLIIGMSAKTDDIMKKAALDAGVDFFIPKPFNVTDLDAILAVHRIGAVPMAPPQLPSRKLADADMDDGPVDTSETKVHNKVTIKVPDSVPI